MIVALVAAISLALLAVRIYAAERIGFGDAEALYACYARHPQPVYLDHPGLIGVVARVLGGGDAPSPFAAHLGTALLCTAAPWIAALAARAAGASWTASAWAAAALLLAPEVSVGLFGMTPDLLLFVLWYAAVLFAALALKSEPGSAKALLMALGSGFAAGLACDSKASGVLLLAGLLLAWTSPSARRHRASLAPWGQAIVALLVFSPVVLDEIERGFPLLRHRFIETQAAAGFSARNVAGLVGGQLVYLTPPLFWAAFIVGRDLHRRRRDDVVSSLLWSLTLTAAPLVVLACWSRVAEPHWVAPMYLALPIHFALQWDRRKIAASPPLVGRILGRLTTAVGVTAAVVAHAWVLLPLGPKLLGPKYEPRYDLANDLYAWRAGLPLLQRALAESLDPETPPPIVVAAHWTVCAQIHAALPASVLVGCASDVADDFSRWLPRATWQRAPVLLFVTDDRFGDAAPTMFSTRRVDAAWHGDAWRGGVPIRRFRVERWVASASAERQ